MLQALENKPDWVNLPGHQRQEACNDACDAFKQGIFTAAVEILLWGAATKLAAAKENNPPGLASEAVGAVGLTVDICVDWATSAPPAIAAKYSTTGINCPVSSTLESLETQIIWVRISANPPKASLSVKACPPICSGDWRRYFVYRSISL
ncbi:MAG: hypothetical protein KME30_10230 [Iphinoe sp. HA4291-MV1]|jgi:hypothetical protein|nr:hypothetical protein [Iphinoe sp. HA4291-MV1]